MACRDEKKMHAARDKLTSFAAPGSKVSTEILDLQSLASVRDFANRYNDSGRRLDVLLNNAGIMACPELRTKDGFEAQFGTNLGSLSSVPCFGPFLQAAILIPVLIEVV